MQPPERPADGDGYLSKTDGPETELRIKGSRFIGQVLSAGSLQEASAALARIRRRYHDATHHCSAYRLGPPGSPIQRSDDDGEPSGSAGAPILAVIEHDDVFDLIVVVTRYYGGTKLGTGGLVRAYGESARLALDEAPFETIWCHRTLALECGYDDVGTVEAMLSKHGQDVVSVERLFDETPRLNLTVRRSRAQGMIDALREATAGRVIAQVVENKK